jgi:hypothetical protein
LGLYCKANESRSERPRKEQRLGQRCRPPARREGRELFDWARVSHLGGAHGQAVLGQGGARHEVRACSHVGWGAGEAATHFQIGPQTQAAIVGQRCNFSPPPSGRAAGRAEQAAPPLTVVASRKQGQELWVVPGVLVNLGAGRGASGGDDCNTREGAQQEGVLRLRASTERAATAGLHMRQLDERIFVGRQATPAGIVRRIPSGLSGPMNLHSKEGAEGGLSAALQSRLSWPPPHQGVCARRSCWSAEASRAGVPAYTPVSPSRPPLLT